jgi:hypothetical protein
VPLSKNKSKLKESGLTYKLFGFSSDVKSLIAKSILSGSYPSHSFFLTSILTISGGIWYLAA